METEIKDRNPLALPVGYELQKRYRIGKILGAGGFGITYKAYDMINKGFCAVKEYVPLGLCIRSENQTDLAPSTSEKEYDYQHGKERFMKEAATLLEVADIPNIVRLTDYFEDNGTAYYVMEYLDGCTLRQLQKAMPGKKLPFQDTYNILQIIGNSLERVHDRKNLLHRDISPDNIFYTKDNKVKLIDFGSAKHVCGQGNQKFSVLIKQGFAPPEQYRSDSRQGRYTDVYALASTFYCLITGKMLPDATERMAGTTYTPAWQLVPEMTRQMSNVLDRALQLDYRTRYQAVSEFLREFDSAWKDAQPPGGQVGAQKSAPILKNANEGLEGIGKGKVPTAVLRWKENQQMQQAAFPADVMVSIGRSEKLSQISIRGYQAISKVHCYIQLDGSSGKYLVKDVSTNGIFVGKVKLLKNQVYAIDEGTKINLAGQCLLELGAEYGQ